MSKFIEKVHIENFKSIESIDLNCKRINIFIGPPGSGKSNILEAIGLISKYTLDKYPESIRIKKYREDNFFLYREIFHYKYTDSLPIGPLIIKINDGELKVHYNVVLYKLDYIKNKIMDDEVLKNFYERIKLYRFDRNKIIYSEVYFKDFLLPPFGENLFTLLKLRLDLIDYLNDKLFSDMYIELKRTGGLLYIYINLPPFNLEKMVKAEVLSESILKLIFDILAIETNKDSIILLDAKVNNNFDFYIEDITTRISESDNQFFIETDNDIFLRKLIEKVGLKDIKVFWTELWGTTQIVEIPENKLKEFIDQSDSNLYSLMKKYAKDYLFEKIFS